MSPSSNGNLGGTQENRNGQFASFQAPRNGIIAGRMLDTPGHGRFNPRGLGFTPLAVFGVLGRFGRLFFLVCFFVVFFLSLGLAVFWGGKAAAGRISPVRRCLQESNPTWDEQEQSKGG